MTDNLCDICALKLDCAVYLTLFYSGPKNDVLREVIKLNSDSMGGKHKVPDCYTVHTVIPYCDTYVSGDTCNKESGKCQN